MAVVLRERGKSKVYWVSFYTTERLPNGKRKQQWERVGPDKRAAHSLDRQRKREVREGAYARALSPTMPFGDWLRRWLDARTNRGAKDERPLVERFLLTRKWLCQLPCEQVRPVHTKQLVDELKATPNLKTGRPISEKYVSNIYGFYTTACRDARIAELIPVDPCVLKHGTLKRKSRRGIRVNYEMEDVVLLSSCPDSKAMVFAMLALLTGMREGEVCGRRWRDWDQHSMPLGCLSVTTQYDDQPLKTEDDEGGEHPRKVPVAPALARLLGWWWQSGFEFAYCRKPTRDDWIVPRTKDGSKCHTRSSGYKLWRKACELSGASNRSLHSTRHTFTTLCRRAGARAEVVQQITHNAAGTMVDHYTHWDWAPLCDAVQCLGMLLDQNLDQEKKLEQFQLLAGGGAGNRSGVGSRQSPAILGILHKSPVPEHATECPGIPQSAAPYCTGQELRTRWLVEASGALCSLALAAGHDVSIGPLYAPPRAPPRREGPLPAPSAMGAP